MGANQRVLILTPGYPSAENPYTCAFVHTRVKEYLNQDLVCSVCVVNPWLRDDEGLNYEFDGVAVRARKINGIREILRSEGPFAVIVAHMPSAELLNVLERESATTPIVVVFHGGDVLCEWYPCTEGRGYFSAAEPLWRHAGEYVAKKELFGRLSRNPAFHWVFVSSALKRLAEEFLGFGFGLNAEVIPNWIREDRFVYREKSADARKKIFFCRRFDDERVYCIDTVMLAIRRLAKRPFFKELEFHVYGDGRDYERLTAPVRMFKNIILHRYFVPNEQLPELHRDCGIALFPSRYDAQGVAVSEAALSGLVPIAGDIPVMRDVYPQEKFGILVNPDSPDELAAAIERLYADPERFLRLSNAVSVCARELFGREKTIGRECELVKRLMKPSEVSPLAAPDAEPLLSVIVPSFNMEKYLSVCLGSLVAQERVRDLEVLIINDGSSDSTLAIARSFESRYPGIVRVLDKPNGGHGSCINAALKVVRGRYVRIVDADDWVISENLGKMLKRMEDETADCILTLGQYDYVETGKTAPIFAYDNLIDGQVRSFDEMQFAGYGFKGYGPTLSTASWKRTVLLGSRTHIDEGVSYADMQWNVLPLRRAETVVLYDLDIYRYTMGRPDQSVARANVLKRWRDHDRVFTDVANFALEDPDLTSARRKYVLHNILGEFGCNDIFVLYCAKGIGAVREFLSKWADKPDLLGEVVRFTYAQGGDSNQYLLSIAEGRKAIRTYEDENLAADPQSAVAVPRRRGKLEAIKAVLQHFGIGPKVRKFIKGLIPYGIVRAWQKKIYKF